MDNNTNSFTWKLKKTLFFIFIFVPFLQWVVFFIMNGRIPKKRWLLMGFANLAAIIVAVFIGFMGDVYMDRNRPSRPAGQPKVSDYLGSNYWDIEDYDKTPEYEQYSKDYDDYLESPEYVAYDEAYSRAATTSNNIKAVGTAFQVISWFVFMILGFFVERYRYIRALENDARRDNVYGRLAKRVDTSVENRVENRTDNRVESRVESSKMTETESLNLIDVNRASEEELMTLPGMKTIDAKKIIDYRNAHGAFSTTDEFFESFDAKPHIMVKMMRSITLNDENNGSAKKEQTPLPGPSETKRRFDL